MGWRKVCRLATALTLVAPAAALVLSPHSGRHARRLPPASPPHPVAANKLVSLRGGGDATSFLPEAWSRVDIATAGYLAWGVLAHFFLQVQDPRAVPWSKFALGYAFKVPSSSHPHLAFLFVLSTSVSFQPAPSFACLRTDWHVYPVIKDAVLGIHRHAPQIRSCGWSERLLDDAARLSAYDTNHAGSNASVQTHILTKLIGYDLSSCVLTGHGADAAPYLQAHFVKRILEVLLLHDFSGSPTGQSRPKRAHASGHQRRELQPGSHACTCLC